MYNPAGRRYIGPPPRDNRGGDVGIWGNRSGVSPFNLPPPSWRGPGWTSPFFGQSMPWLRRQPQPIGPPLVNPNQPRDFLGPVMEPPPRWLGPPPSMSGPVPGMDLNLRPSLFSNPWGR